ncbi:MAG: hypothetical protein JWO57_1849, partial [Pseudonocardiales bacterium]|nr:hypothetical protein [Pseudonocardiales bacterium]
RAELERVAHELTTARTESTELDNQLQAARERIENVQAAHDLAVNQRDEASERLRWASSAFAASMRAAVRRRWRPAR